MPKQPNEEQEVIHYKVFLHQEQTDHNERNSYGVQSQPNPYHWSLPKSDKINKAIILVTIPKINYFLRDDAQESLSTKVNSS